MPTTETSPKNSAAAAEALARVDRNLVEQIGEKVLSQVGKGKLVLPPNYVAENAMKEAWLALQNVKTADHKLALEVCEKNSIVASMLDMMVQGLSPRKKQCYFIAYGPQLTCQRSYMGSMAVARRVRPEIRDFVYACVYAKDKFSYRMSPNGGRQIVEHEQALANISDTEIIGAYASAVGADGTVLRTEVMTIAEIHRAWKQSRANPFNGSELKGDSTHAKFTAEMACKTVIGRLCKRIINMSDDADLLRDAIDRSDPELAPEDDGANTGEIVDISVPESEPPSPSSAAAATSAPDPAPAATTAQGGPDW